MIAPSGQGSGGLKILAPPSTKPGSHFTFLGFSFIVCKMEIIILSFLTGWL